MTTVTAGMTISLDGFTSGPNQRLDAPFGDGVGDRLHRWMFETPEENEAEIASLTGQDAYLMGRNMFGPGRGAWDLEWRGWWGEEPPYHAPVFVLTHHAREPLEMAGGTTFHFVTTGTAEALARAKAVAGADGRIGIAGGATTLRQYLLAGLVDELTLSVAPLVMGDGERLLDGLAGLGLDLVATRGASLVSHLTYRVVSPPPA